MKMIDDKNVKLKRALVKLEKLKWKNVMKRKFWMRHRIARSCVSRICRQLLNIDLKRPGYVRKPLDKVRHNYSTSKPEYLQSRYNVSSSRKRSMFNMEPPKKKIKLYNETCPAVKLKDDDLSSNGNKEIYTKQKNSGGDKSKLSSPYKLLDCSVILGSPKKIESPKRNSISFMTKNGVQVISMRAVTIPKSKSLTSLQSLKDNKPLKLSSSSSSENSNHKEENLLSLESKDNSNSDSSVSLANDTPTTTTKNNNSNGEIEKKPLFRVRSDLFSSDLKPNDDKEKIKDESPEEDKINVESDFLGFTNDKEGLKKPDELKREKFSKLPLSDTESAFSSSETESSRSSGTSTSSSSSSSSSSEDEEEEDPAFDPSTFLSCAMKEIDEKEEIEEIAPSVQSRNFQLNNEVRILVEPLRAKDITNMFCYMNELSPQAGFNVRKSLRKMKFTSSSYTYLEEEQCEETPEEFLRNLEDSFVHSLFAPIIKKDQPKRKSLVKIGPKRFCNPRIPVHVSSIGSLQINSSTNSTFVSPLGMHNFASRSSGLQGYPPPGFSRPYDGKSIRAVKVGNTLYSPIYHRVGSLNIPMLRPFAVQNPNAVPIYRPTSNTVGVLSSPTNAYTLGQPAPNINNIPSYSSLSDSNSVPLIRPISSSNKISYMPPSQSTITIPYMNPRTNSISLLTPVSTSNTHSYFPPVSNANSQSFVPPPIVNINSFPNSATSQDKYSFVVLQKGSQTFVKSASSSIIGSAPPVINMGNNIPSSSLSYPPQNLVHQSQIPNIASSSSAYPSVTAHSNSCIPASQPRINMSTVPSTTLANCNPYSSETIQKSQDPSFAANRSFVPTNNPYIPSSSYSKDSYQQSRAGVIVTHSGNATNNDAILTNSYINSNDNYRTHNNDSFSNLPHQTNSNLSSVPPPTSLKLNNATVSVSGKSNVAFSSGSVCVKPPNSQKVIQLNEQATHINPNSSNQNENGTGNSTILGENTPNDFFNLEKDESVPKRCSKDTPSREKNDIEVIEDPSNSDMSKWMQEIQETDKTCDGVWFGKYHSGILVPIRRYLKAFVSQGFSANRNIILNLVFQLLCSRMCCSGHAHTLINSAACLKHLNSIFSFLNIEPQQTIFGELSIPALNPRSTYNFNPGYDIVILKRFVFAIDKVTRVVLYPLPPYCSPKDNDVMDKITVVALISPKLGLGPGLIIYQHSIMGRTLLGSLNSKHCGKFSKMWSLSAHIKGGLTQSMIMEFLNNESLDWFKSNGLNSTCTELVVDWWWCIEMKYLDKFYANFKTVSLHNSYASYKDPLDICISLTMERIWGKLVRKWKTAHTTLLEHQFPKFILKVLNELCEPTRIHKWCEVGGLYPVNEEKRKIFENFVNNT